LEPKRLFRRYVLGNPLFIARALRLAASSPRTGRGTAT
jgi:N-acetylglucosaminyldiphosphoundecaprenol N-acetyl-beta-D-mannosaminyltransferase